MASFCLYPGTPGGAATLTALIVTGTPTKIVKGVGWIGPGPYAVLTLMSPFLFVGDNGLRGIVGAIMFGYGTEHADLNGGRMAFVPLADFSTGMSGYLGDGVFTVAYQ